MNRFFSLSLVISLFGISSLVAQSNNWVTAYYAGWSQGRYNNGILPAGEIDFSAVTHVIHFAILPKADGTINFSSNTVVEDNSKVLLEKAHAAGRKVLISVGGWGSEDVFREATSLLKRSAFIENLIAFMKERGYDGIDIDWEPLRTTDVPQYTLFITELRLRLSQMNPRPLLTAAVASQPAAIAALINDFDQVNVMTYDMSGAWPGWVVWHSSPLSNSGLTFPSTGGALPSASDLIDRYIAAGVPASKLGIGLPFYGYVWSGGDGTPTGGVTEPLQTWSTAPSVRANVSYADIMEQYYQPSLLRWDGAAETAYLSIDNPGSSNDKFISIEDERSIWEKFEYAREKGLGGVFIWELGGGHRNDLPEGERDDLLQAVKKSAQGIPPPPPPTDVTAPTVSFLSPSEGDTLTGTAEITANATDNVGVIAVQFKLDGNNLEAEDTSPPFTISLNTAQLSNGPHTIAATARDAAGNTSTKTVDVVIKNESGDTEVPAVVFSTPAEGDTVSGSITVTVNATDNVGIIGVQFAVDGNNVGNEDTSSPYSASLSTGQLSNGTHTITATARDSAGNKTTRTLSVVVKNETEDTVAPTVALTEPADGSTLSGTVTLRATATDNVGVTSVQFRLNDNNLGNPITAPPFEYEWNTTSVSDGAHTLKIVATDAAGNSSSASISVTILNTFALAAPVLTSPSDWATGVDLSPTLQWQATPGASLYEVQVSTSTSFSSLLVDQTGLTATLLHLNGLEPGTRYHWKVRASNNAGVSPFSDSWRFRTESATSVENIPGEIPVDYTLFQNYPNPFNPATAITFALPEESRIRITVVDLLGKEIALLTQEEFNAGYYRVQWDGRDARGSVVGNGLYLYRLEAASRTGKSFAKTMKMVFLK